MLSLIVLILVFSCLIRSRQSREDSLVPFEYNPIAKLFLLVAAVTPLVLILVVSLGSYPA